jgi:hypothetical protein
LTEKAMSVRAEARAFTVPCGNVFVDALLKPSPFYQHA